jgi:hypothetical protein
MRILLHGEDQVKSRKYLSTLKNKAKKNKEILSLNGANVSLTELKQALEANSLFGHDKVVILENIFSARKSKRKKQLIKYLNKESPQIDLIIWEEVKVGKRALNKLPKSFQKKEFKISTVIFKFLESLQPGNNQNSLTLLKKSLSNNEPEKIFYMLVRQIRLLIIAKDLGKPGLSGPGWIKNKLITQTKAFTKNQLLSVHSKLLNIDISIKRGKSLMPLQKQLELLTANL